MSTTTWNSLLLSNGSIFSTTSWTTASDTDARIATTMPMPSSDAPARRRVRVDERRQQPRERRREPAVEAAPAGSPRRAVLRRELQREPRRDHERDRERDQHPHARVDRDRAHVRAHEPGDERHRQQRGDHGERGEDRRPADLVDRRRDQRRRAAPRGSSARWRWMFSTTTIASSTRMPIEKISANRLTRFSVKPHAHDANSVAASVSITAMPTIAASRQAERDEHQRDHRQRREQQLADQQLRLVVGGAAVVAGDRRLDAGGNHGVARARPGAARRAAATSTAFSPAFLVTWIVTAG